MNNLKKQNTSFYNARMVLRQLLAAKKINKIQYYWRLFIFTSELFATKFVNFTKPALSHIAHAYGTSLARNIFISVATLVFVSFVAVQNLLIDFAINSWGAAYLPATTMLLTSIIAMNFLLQPTCAYVIGLTQKLFHAIDNEQVISETENQLQPTLINTMLRNIAKITNALPFRIIPVSQLLKFGLIATGVSTVFAIISAPALALPLFATTLGLAFLENINRRVTIHQALLKAAVFPQPLEESVVTEKLKELKKNDAVHDCFQSTCISLKRDLQSVTQYTYDNSKKAFDSFERLTNRMTSVDKNLIEHILAYKQDFLLFTSLSAEQSPNTNLLNLLENVSEGHQYNRLHRISRDNTTPMRSVQLKANNM